VHGERQIVERVDGAEAEKGQDLLVQKYGWMKRLGDFFSRLRGRVQCVLAIELD